MTKDLIEEDLEWKMHTTDFFIKSLDVPKILRDLASSGHFYKIELVRFDKDQKMLIRRIGPELKNNLDDLLETYEPKFSLWIVMFPSAYLNELDIPCQECEIYLDHQKAPKNFLRYCYMFKDPREDHECIFGKEYEPRVKPRCDYLANLLKEYLTTIPNSSKIQN